jgi:hypothetical protein
MIAFTVPNPVSIRETVWFPVDVFAVKTPFSNASAT